MAHDHSHEDSSSYYLEQLCTIGICGAFAGVTVLLWWNGSLKFMLAEKFHLPVMLGGVALFILVVIRAVALWDQVGKTSQNHNHDHDHDHGHDHEHCAHHDHAHEHHHHDHGHCAHDHGHSHEHEHGIQAKPPDATNLDTYHTDQEPEPALASAASCGHDHGHDHGWNPWRYTLLLLPIVLFFLNLPNKGFTSSGKAVDIGDEEHAVVAKGNGVISLGFKEMSQWAYNEDQRKEFEGEQGVIKGQFMPGRNDRTFGLVRYKITCCAADAIPLNVVIISKEPIQNIRPNQWVKVTGQIQFRKRLDRDEYVPVLSVESRNNVELTPPDDNPYIQ